MVNVRIGEGNLIPDLDLGETSRRSINCTRNLKISLFRLWICFGVSVSHHHGPIMSKVTVSFSLNLQKELLLCTASPCRSLKFHFITISCSINVFFLPNRYDVICWKTAQCFVKCTMQSGTPPVRRYSSTLATPIPPKNRSLGYENGSARPCTMQPLLLNVLWPFLASFHSFDWMI